MLKNTENSYGTIARSLHWLISMAIICLIIAGFIMTNMVDSTQKWQVYGLHKATGVVVLLLASLRLVWKFSNLTVKPLANLLKWQIQTARLVHILLYVFMFVMPISGLLMSITGGRDVSIYGLFTIKAILHNVFLAKIFWQIHGYSAYILVILLGVHISVAFYHHFIYRDNTLMRMIKG